MVFGNIKHIFSFSLCLLFHEKGSLLISITFQSSPTIFLFPSIISQHTSFGKDFLEDLRTGKKCWFIFHPTQISIFLLLVTCSLNIFFLQMKSKKIIRFLVQRWMSKNNLITFKDGKIEKFKKVLKLFWWKIMMIFTKTFLIHSLKFSIFHLPQYFLPSIIKKLPPIPKLSLLQQKTMIGSKKTQKNSKI